MLSAGVSCVAEPLVVAEMTVEKAKAMLAGGVMDTRCSLCRAKATTRRRKVGKLWLRLCGDCLIHRPWRERK